MSKSISVGVIGVGHLGRHHARIFAALEGVVLAGLYDRDYPKTKRVAGELGVPAFANLQALFDQVQVVSIVVPTTAHAEIACAALACGKDVFIEKPISATLPEADRIIALSQEKQALVQVGQIERFNPCFAALENFPLDPLFIEVHRLAGFSPRGLDVAVVLDLMIHDIDLVCHLVKAPLENVQAASAAVISDSDDIANARLVFANGCVANLTASRISPKPMRKVRIFQKNAYLSLDLADKKVDLYELVTNADGSLPPQAGVAGGSTVPLFQFPVEEGGRAITFRQPPVPEYDMLTRELESFVRAIRTRSAPAVSAQEGRRALEVALTVLQKGQAQRRRTGIPV